MPVTSSINRLAGPPVQKLDLFAEVERFALFDTVSPRLQHFLTQKLLVPEDSIKDFLIAIVTERRRTDQVRYLSERALQTGRDRTISAKFDEDDLWPGSQSYHANSFVRAYINAHATSVFPNATLHTSPQPKIVLCVHQRPELQEASAAWHRQYASEVPLIALCGGLYPITATSIGRQIIASGGAPLMSFGGELSNETPLGGDYRIGAHEVWAMGGFLTGCLAEGLRSVCERSQAMAVPCTAIKLVSQLTYEDKKRGRSLSDSASRMSAGDRLALLRGYIEQMFGYPEDLAIEQVGSRLLFHTTGPKSHPITLEFV